MKSNWQEFCRACTERGKDKFAGFSVSSDVDAIHSVFALF